LLSGEKQAKDFSFNDVKMGQHVAPAVALLKPKYDNFVHYYGKGFG